MKKFFALLVLFILVSIFGLISNFWHFDKRSYLDDKVLDMASPVDGTIDIELFKSLVPAYEQQ
jgi:hypothetical protein